MPRHSARTHCDRPAGDIRDGGRGESPGAAGEEPVDGGSRTESVIDAEDRGGHRNEEVESEQSKILADPKDVEIEIADPGRILVQNMRIGNLEFQLHRTSSTEATQSQNVGYAASSSQSHTIHSVGADLSRVNLNPDNAGATGFSDPADPFPVNKAVPLFQSDSHRSPVRYCIRIHRRRYPSTCELR